MRVTTLLNKLLNLPGLWVTGIELRADALIVLCRRRFRLLTCRKCGPRVRARFEENRRRWRHLAMWGWEVWIDAPIRRLRCRTCRTCRKVQTEAVPWAR